MKLGCAIIFTALLVLPGFSQDKAPITKAKTKSDIEIAAPQAPKAAEVNTNALGPLKNTTNKEPTFAFSGLAVDVAHSTNRWKMFSLRRKVDLKEDNANLIRDTRTEAAPAIKLFSIDFK